MKKSLLLIASLLMSSVSAFAQWTKPEPKTEAMATDGSYQYLYNVEAAGFFIGMNEWGTRASVSSTKGYKVKIQPVFEDEEKTVPLGTYAITDSCETKSAWFDTDCQTFDGVWVDGTGRGGADMWRFTALGNNLYEFTNDNVVGKLGMAKLFDGLPNDRLFMLSPENEALVNNDESLRYEGACTTWTFVSEAEYVSIVPKIAAYAAAMNLKEKIDAAKEKYNGIDLSAAEAVYNNTANNDSVLNAALPLIDEAIVAYQKNVASVANPADMTDVIPNHNFDEGKDGWTTTTGAQNTGTATNRTNQNDYPGTPMTGQFWENWDPNAFAGKLYTTLNNLPAGVYKMTIDAFANGGSNTWVYANNDSVRTGGVNTLGETNIPISDKPATYTLFTLVGEDGKLEMGLTQPTKEANWVGLDNATLTYYGAALDAYQLWFKNLRNAVIADMNALVTPETKYNKSQKEAFEAALKAGDNATTVEEMLASAEVLTSVAQETMASIKAYNAYIAKRSEVDEYIASHDLNGDAAGILADYIMEDAIEPDETYPNGNYGYIMDNCQLSTEEVTSETAFLAQIFLDAINGSLQPGQVADFLVNASFKDGFDGWVKPGAGSRGGLDIFPSVEVYDNTVDISQVVTGVPNGVYSLSCNAFYRPGGNGSYDGSEESPVVLYMNEFETPVQNIVKDAMPADKAEDLVNCYISQDVVPEGMSVLPGTPNSLGDYEVMVDGVSVGWVPNSMTGASIAFKADRYNQKVYGIVTDGTMKIGLTSKGQKAHWVLWSNFVLTYEGMSMDAMNALGQVYVENAQATLEASQDGMSQPAIDALNNAINAVDEADEAEAKYDAIIALNKEVAAAHDNVKAVEAFNNAKDAMDAAADEYFETATAEAQAAYNGMQDMNYEELTTEQLKAQTDKMNEVAGKLRVPDYAGASDDNAIDFTQIIVNPNFDSDASGWSGDGAAHNAEVGDAEFYNKNFNFYQELYGLPAGTYELKVQGYYRQGNAEPDYKNYTGTPVYNAKLFANNDSIGLIQPSSAAVESRTAITDYAKCGAGTDGDLYIPNTMTTGGQAFAQGLYWNSLIFSFDGKGSIKIGLDKKETISGDWTLFDNFQLFYYGTDSKKDTGIKDAENSKASIVSIYNAAGQKTLKLTKGINIVKMSDNSVQKVLVK